jgi:hypothetical protein
LPKKQCFYLFISQVLANKKRSRIALERLILIFGVIYRLNTKKPLYSPILSDTRVFLLILKRDFLLLIF